MQKQRSSQRLPLSLQDFIMLLQAPFRNHRHPSCRDESIASVRSKVTASETSEAVVAVLATWLRCSLKSGALYRFRGGSEGVRSDFVNFCAKQIEEHFWQVKSRHDEGLVYLVSTSTSNLGWHLAGGFLKFGLANILRYCSLGCGCLYFDWELLDQLVTNARPAPRDSATAAEPRVWWQWANNT